MGVAQETLRELHLLPSILSADFSRLGEEIAAVMEAGVKGIHVDVMDGHFVPNITVGPPVVRSISPLVRARGGFLSVHLMIERPERYLREFVEAGADALSVHAESCPCLYHALTSIKRLGAAAGLAINPGTSLGVVEEVASYLDFVLVMTVNPGFGGQKLIESALARVPQIRAMLPDSAGIEIDGGINESTLARVVRSGANWLVAGAAVFGAPDPAGQARRLQDLMVAAGQVC
ncbi:MAG: ribulose-phosphate 3-epimerase [Thermoleophilia bacterium]|nr:ribulose-phosphate 3-epimerase [Thermoleophilia bacterium]